MPASRRVDAMVERYKEEPRLRDMLVDLVEEQAAKDRKHRKEMIASGEWRDITKSNRAELAPEARAAKEASLQEERRRAAAREACWRPGRRGSPTTSRRWTRRTAQPAAGCGGSGHAASRVLRKHFARAAGKVGGDRQIGAGDGGFACVLR